MLSNIMNISMGNNNRKECSAVKRCIPRQISACPEKLSGYRIALEAGLYSLNSN
ncbi:hypothetical protein [Mucilaginibacter gracilis]|uniref:hypothetical protein n=1 Tax=Mucilaginibacter gracilis TaxID=423350 RepID=UPI0013C35A2A|nr:hypothetical protein [Mucilaginibacter gracilis]